MHICLLVATPTATMGSNTLLRRCTILSRRHLRTSGERTLATHAPLPEKDCSSITPPYTHLQEKLALVRQILGNRPLTLAEKILYSHITDPERSLADGRLNRGETYLQLSPERVAMQDASAQCVELNGLCLHEGSHQKAYWCIEWHCKSYCSTSLHVID